MNKENQQRMIYIICPVHQRLKSTQAFIKKIREFKSCDQIFFIITDDGPNLENYHYFKDQKNIFAIALKSDHWWGGGINAGIQYLLDKIKPSEGDLCIFANNDVIIQEESFEKIISFLKKTKFECLIHPQTKDHSGKYISSGSIVKSWFPFITHHPLRLTKDKIQIDLTCARCLCFKVGTLKKIGLIDSSIPHYHGDNYFSYSAKQKNIPTFILKDAFCIVDDTQTGKKNVNIITWKELWNSFFDIKSTNCIKYRLAFNRLFFGPVFSCLIVTSMTLNAVIKLFLRKMRFFLGSKRTKKN